MLRCFPACLFALVVTAHLSADETEWTQLFDEKLSAFKSKPGEWQQVADVSIDPKTPRRFVPKEGTGAWYNGLKGRTNDLYTKKKFGDVELHLEFNLPKGSNSGVKFHGHYEIQICDSFGKKEISGEDCGGVYPRAVVDKGYRHIDKGIAPKLNACKAPGEWQTLDAIFHAPRFDAEGKKTANAKLVKVVLNGQVIHDQQELQWPTGDRWKNPEMAVGHLMIQGDHGPIAYRNVKIRELKAKNALDR